MQVLVVLVSISAANDVNNISTWLCNQWIYGYLFNRADRFSSNTPVL